MLEHAAGLDWMVRAVDLRAALPDDRPVRRRGVAIAGRDSSPRSTWLLTDAPLPERTLLAETTVEGVPLTVGSYHTRRGHLGRGETAPSRRIRLMAGHAARADAVWGGRQHPAGGCA